MRRVTRIGNRLMTLDKNHLQQKHRNLYLATKPVPKNCVASRTRSCTIGLDLLDGEVKLSYGFRAAC